MSDKTKELVNLFMDQVEVTEGLTFSMFNLHLYDDTFIEASVAEEHDLGGWIYNFCEHGDRFSSELTDKVTIRHFLRKVQRLNNKMEEWL